MKKFYAAVIIFTIFFTLASLGFAADDQSKPAQIKLTAQDIDFLTKQCLIDKADVDIIPKLPPDGLDRIQLVLESSRKNCNMEAIKSFKATRDFVRKYTKPPESPVMPPKGYSHDFLTTEESNYINDINKKLLDKAFDNFNKNLKKGN